MYGKSRSLVLDILSLKYLLHNLAKMFQKVATYVGIQLVMMFGLYIKFRNNQYLCNI